MAILETGIATTTESRFPAVNWGPVFAGALTATAATLVLMLLGTGLGMTMVSPWGNEGVTATTFAVSSAIWLVIVAWLSSGLGGYLTGRLRTKWVGVHTDEVYFRDTAHGFLAWAVGTLFMAAVLGSTLSSIVSGGAAAVSTVAGGAAMGATAAADTDTAGSATSYFVDSLFRPADATRLSAPGAEGDAAAASQASRILLESATTGTLTPEDKTYLAQLVAARTGLSQPDAEARIDAVMARIEAAKVQAQEAADTARKAAATFGLLATLSLVIGAFIASAAAALGGKQRDDDEAVFVTRR